MSRRIADAFAEMVAAQLPSDSDRQRFLEAARGLLDIDDDLRRLNSKDRRRLVHGDIDTEEDRNKVFDALWSAIERTAKEPRSQGDDAEAIYRISMAYMVGKGLRGVQQRHAFKDATLLLLEFWRDAKRLRRSKDGARRYSSRISPPLKKRLEALAHEWRVKNPQASTTALADYIHSLQPSKWRNANTARVWLYRNCPDLIRKL